MVPDDQLEELARARFPDPPLTAAEIKLVRGVPKGEYAVCGPNRDDNDPQNNPSTADKDWKEDRQIRAALIRWLCVDKQARELVDPEGIQVYGASIIDQLELDFVNVQFPLGFFRCRLSLDAYFRHTTIPELLFHGTWTRSVQADGVRVTGPVFMRQGFRAEGEVRLRGAQIGGDLDCVGGEFNNPAQKDIKGSGTALNADRIDVGGTVFLRDGFRAEGEVRLLGAHIGSNLDCSGGEFTNPAQKNVKDSGIAFHADGINVRGAVFLRDEFQAEGEVRLTGAQVDGQIDCSGGKFTNSAKDGSDSSGRALSAGQMKVRAGMLLYGDFHVDGRLSLESTSVGAISDDSDSWPAKGSLNLDGFTYKRIHNQAKNAKSRLDWLSRMEKFAPQPYRQLAKIMREEGDDPGARKVLMEMERLRRKSEDKIWYRRVWSWILRKTVGYGYYPGYSLIWLLALVSLGWLAFWSGYRAGNIVPTEKDAYWTFALEHEPPSHYEHFHALSYSLENSFPLLKLGQADRWQPEPKRSFSPHFLVSPTFLRCFRWLQTVLGWVLATFFVVGLTGTLQKDKD